MAGKTIFLEPIINEATENIGELESKMELVAERMEIVAAKLTEVANNTSQAITAIHTIAGEDIISVQPATDLSVKNIHDSTVTVSTTNAIATLTTTTPKNIPLVNIAGVATGTAYIDITFNPTWQIYSYNKVRFGLVAVYDGTEEVILDYIDYNSGKHNASDLNITNKKIKISKDYTTKICLRALSNNSSGNQNIVLWDTSGLGVTEHIMIKENNINIKYDLTQVTEKPFDIH